MTDVLSIDPRTGEPVEVVAPETTTAEVNRLCTAALAAALASMRSAARAGRRCRTLADGLERRRDDVVPVADRETALGTTRLNGELTRTCYQLRLFAEVLEEGSYLEAAIDHAGETPMGARPDLRRMLVPVGPVAVFGSSNFPLAFSVPGGDTASALAAGCPVVVKAHSSHPATSQLVFEVMNEAARAAGAPDGTLGIVYGQQAGAHLVAHPAIRAVGFTGSVNGGRALLQIIEQRPDPIPFYGELSSLNPVVVTPSAAAERATRSAASWPARSPSGGASSAPSPASPSCLPARTATASSTRCPRRSGGPVPRYCSTRASPPPTAASPTAWPRRSAWRRSPVVRTAPVRGSRRCPGCCPRPRPTCLLR